MSVGADRVKRGEDWGCGKGGGGTQEWEEGDKNRERKKGRGRKFEPLVYPTPSISTFCVLSHLT